MTVTVRRSTERGHAQHGWLDTRHSFSFADYYDPKHMGFRSLRVINEDVIQPAKGFGTHGHRDMEILTYVISGALEHRDSTGGHSVIGRGEVQRMTAGTGIRHSEFNASAVEPVKLLQVWLLPAREGLTPDYEQKLFTDAEKRNRLCPLATPDRRNGSLAIHQDADVYSALLERSGRVDLPLGPGRAAWVQIVYGQATVNGQQLGAGDGAAVESVDHLTVVAETDSEMLVFDLA